nr:hypothetical protein CFP56_63758 [Quercus suber]
MDTLVCVMSSATACRFRVSFLSIALISVLNSDVICALDMYYTGSTSILRYQSRKSKLNTHDRPSRAAFGRQSFCLFSRSRASRRRLVCPGTDLLPSQSQQKGQGAGSPCHS